MRCVYCTQGIIKGSPDSCFTIVGLDLMQSLNNRCMSFSQVLSVDDYFALTFFRQLYSELYTCFLDLVYRKLNLSTY